jgi:signal transduction histidine kinase
MPNLRLRTQLFITTLLLIGALTGTSLLIVRHLVRSEIERQVRHGIDGSIQAFKSVEWERELQLSRSVAMLAELPTLKALMTTEHEPTIQDGSERFWKLAGTDLFVLAKSDGELMALHISMPGWGRSTVEDHLKTTIEHGTGWWYENGTLFWVVARPLVAGSDEDAEKLGWIAAGYEVDSRVAERLARVAGSQIALRAGNQVIASTLTPSDAGDLQAWIARESILLPPAPQEIALGAARYEIASVLLESALPTPIECYVLMPLQQANDFMHRLNRTLVVLGAAAVVLAAVLFSFISRAITRPLENLVAGVRALAGGDYFYSITPRGSSEVAELGKAFANMRLKLHESQQKLIEAERTAALGRTASSVSHDLRHYLAAVVANAEFLYEADDLKLNRDEIYQEIKTASAQMTDLIDSLRELAREHNALYPASGDLEMVVRRAIEAVRARQEFRTCDIVIQSTDPADGVFDPNRLERAFFNLVLNACEATGSRGHVRIGIRVLPAMFEVTIADDGAGIPAAIRDTLFDPFVSSGKSNGTGLGLAIVSKILHDHGGSIAVEQTSEAGTVILVRIPRRCPSPEPSGMREVPTELTSRKQAQM